MADTNQELQTALSRGTKHITISREAFLAAASGNDKFKAALSALKDATDVLTVTVLAADFKSDEDDE